MLPVLSWVIHYADGSTFSSDSGFWAEAPPFGVQAVVYYHVPDSDGLRRVTVDGGHDNGDVYIWEGDGHLEGVKMGLWMDRDGYYRIADLASRRTTPEV
jgi:hypothetical protein